MSSMRFDDLLGSGERAGSGCFAAGDAEALALALAFSFFSGRLIAML
jgi:hypothetical protein